MKLQLLSIAITVATFFTPFTAKADSNWRIKLRTIDDYTFVEAKTGGRTKFLPQAYIAPNGKAYSFLSSVDLCPAQHLYDARDNHCKPITNGFLMMEPENLITHVDKNNNGTTDFWVGIDPDDGSIIFYPTDWSYNAVIDNNSETTLANPFGEAY